MKRSQIVIAGAERLFATENAVDSALTETGDLIATLTRLRVTSNISGVFGQDAIGAVMDGAAALTAARGHFIRAHGHLVVDRLFAVAELRLGEKHQAVVRITREGPPPAQRASVAFAGSARGGPHD